MNKNIVIFIVIFFISGCQLFTRGRLFSEFIIDSNKKIQLYDMNSGATGKSIIEVYYINTEKKKLISKIYMSDRNKVEYKLKNDSILNIVFRDTAYFIGSFATCDVNLNQTFKDSIITPF